MEGESRIDALISGLNQIKIDKVVDEYLRCEDADDFKKYASLKGFFPPRGYYLYSQDWVHQFWTRRLMAIAYFQDFGAILDRSVDVDSENTDRFRDELVDRFHFHSSPKNEEAAESKWRANEAVRERLKTTRILELNESELQALEGEPQGVTHKIRERDPRIVKAKKRNVLLDTGKLACEVCAFDFRATYGALGIGFAECHHIEPLSTPDRGPITSLADLAIVCANCHRMLHRGKPWPSLSDLKNLITQNSDQS